MRCASRIAVAVALLNLLALAVPQRAVAQQAWIQYQLAEEYALNGRPAQALQMYAEALEMRPNYPEAMVGMARVYDQEGDRILAERYYRLALEQAGQLDIPDDEFRIRMELADLYDRYGEFNDYRDELLTIIARDPVFNNRDGTNQRRAMLNILFEQGLNRVLVLYRLDYPQSLAAHREYADYLVSLGDPLSIAESVDHYLFAVVEIAGRAVEAIIARRFDFEFTTVAALFEAASQYPEVSGYLASSRFEMLLVDFASALGDLEEPAAQRAAGRIRAQLP